MVVSSVDLARYFSWLIGIRYIGFSNLKTFLVISTTEHVLLPTSESESSFLNLMPPDLSTEVSLALTMIVHP